MKNTLLQLGLCLLTAGAMNANVITCSNNAIAAGMYNTIQAACNAANAGDTVYVMGSPTDYGTVTIKTRITLIGAGYAVTGTQNNWGSEVDYIHLDSVAFGNPVSGTKIMGLYINSGVDNSGSAGTINNIDIERCFGNGWFYVEGTGWTIRNCVSYGVQVQNYNYCYIQNNFIGNIQYSNKTTVVIDHNTFNNSSGCFYSMSNALIANNIFYYSSPLANVTSCTFSNNITTNSSAQVLPPAGNTGSGNFNNTPPGWTDGTIPTTTISLSTEWNYSWKLGTSAPAHNSGTDGTDLGAYGGTYPMPNLTGATRIPQMQALNVSGVVPAGGNLNVNFKARKQN